MNTVWPGRWSSVDSAFEGDRVTETIEPVPAQTDQQQLAQEAVSVQSFR